MSPIAFTVFGVAIRWYGILISVGMILGVVVAMKRSAAYRINSEKILDLILIAIPVAIIGARIYYVIFNWSYYSGDFMKIINIRAGGLAIHGGLIGGILAGFIYCIVRRLSFVRILDICIPSIALGQAIGRWGNFFNQEAYGTATSLPWAILIDGVAVHPTFLYESILDFALFIFLILLDRYGKKFNGELFLAYGVIYSIGRFFIEGLRTDSLMLGDFRVAQLISAIIALLCLIAWVYKRRTARKMMFR